MKVFYSDTHRAHNPPFEVLDGGEKSPSFEVPERAERVLSALGQTGWAEISRPDDFGLDPILAVHSPDYIDFLQTAYQLWVAEDMNYEHLALTPATFSIGNFRRKPSSILGRAGYYMMDLSAPIGPGTWQAALQSAYCALSGASALLAGEKSTFALCRPPGHHAGKENCGGYCYLNNAAIAANWLGQHGSVALLDIDYHAGNGTQEIFYERSDVSSISIHADPEMEYPYYAGYADEIGKGAGEGFHRNFPLPSGVGDAGYLAVLGEALDLIRLYKPAFLVLSLGMDICKGDPLGKFNITQNGIQPIGKAIADLHIPMLAVLEGGYNLDELGESILVFLSNFNS